MLAPFPHSSTGVLYLALSTAAQHHWGCVLLEHPRSAAENTIIDDQRGIHHLRVENNGDLKGQVAQIRSNPTALFFASGARVGRRKAEKPARAWWGDVGRVEGMGYL